MLSIPKFPTVTNLQYRHLGAIAALIFISLLSSLSGLSLEQVISNIWDGFLWGLANPVLHLNSLVSIVVIGLLSASVVYSSLITTTFVVAVVLGMILYVLQINLIGAEIAIALATIGCGGMLIIPHQRSWVILTLLAAIAGMFQGYAHFPSLTAAASLPTLTYIIGTILTVYAVVTSAKTIGNSINSENTVNTLFTITRFVGFAVCGLGMVFLSHLTP